MSELPEKYKDEDCIIGTLIDFKKLFDKINKIIDYLENQNANSPKENK